jgi:hypothetical protein
MMEPLTKSQLAAVSEPSSLVPAAAIEIAAAVLAPTRTLAVRAEPTGAVVTAAYAAAILPLKGAANAATLEVLRVPGI